VRKEKMERKKLLSGLLAGITIFAAFGTLVYLLNQRVSPVQACGQKCYYGWNCGANEVCAGWGLPGTQKKCQCRAGNQCVNGKCVKAHKECVNGSCQYVAGAGPNKCSSDRSCKCFDTDGGKNAWVKGTVTCPTEVCNWPSTSKTDQCGGTGYCGVNCLREYYCYSDTVSGEWIVNCSVLDPNAVCQNGRCVRK